MYVLPRQHVHTCGPLMLYIRTYYMSASIASTCLYFTGKALSNLARGEWRAILNCCGIGWCLGTDLVCAAYACTAVESVGTLVLC